ncbi:hypothetical protein BDA99DRAFT_507384 [Phascolomyces articulosus]|uniref:Uncharacterized protein n=1 Tax=Phascolomyces articulosus TaxID=60185 RepID=A0AAD5PEJ1_9FUNG|nr:hypothetical protein BDA99DRAFT_507384 [Phascolomyces articulosus]
MLSILFLPLGGIKPWIDITLPEPIILSYFQLILFYFTLLLIDYILLSNERRIPMRAVQLRVTMAIVHATIPQFIVSNHVVANLFFAAMPWFMLTYCATLPLEHISIQEAYDSFMTIMIDQERLQKIDNGKEKKKITIHSARKETLKYGCTKILRGVIKWIFLFRCIEPLLPENNSYLLSLPWFSWKSMELTLLYGIKGYCFLGIVDIGMGIEEIVLGTPLVDLFDSPIISSSPRDFWR